MERRGEIHVKKCQKLKKKKTWKEKRKKKKQIKPVCSYNEISLHYLATKQGRNKTKKQTLGTFARVQH